MHYFTLALCSSGEKTTPSTHDVVNAKICYSVTEDNQGQILVGRNRGFDVYDTRCKFVKSVEMSDLNIHCIQHYKDMAVALGVDTSDNKRCVAVMDYPYQYGYYTTKWSLPNFGYISNLVASNDKVYVSADSQLYVYSLTGGLYKDNFVKHYTFRKPVHLSTSSPDTVVISDREANKVHELYSTTDTVVWTCSEVKDPRGICCDTNGNVWVWSRETKSIFLISLVTGYISQNMYFKI